MYYSVSQWGRDLGFGIWGLGGEAGDRVAYDELCIVNAIQPASAKVILYTCTQRIKVWVDSVAITMIPSGVGVGRGLGVGCVFGVFFDLFFFFGGESFGRGLGFWEEGW